MNVDVWKRSFSCLTSVLVRDNVSLADSNDKLIMTSVRFRSWCRRLLLALTDCIRVPVASGQVARSVTLSFCLTDVNKRWDHFHPLDNSPNDARESQIRLNILSVSGRLDTLLVRVNFWLLSKHRQNTWLAKHTEEWIHGKKRSMLKNIDTHTHTHTHTHSPKHGNTYTHTQARTQTHKSTWTHTYTHKYAHTHTLVHVNTYILTQAHTYIYLQSWRIN